MLSGKTSFALEVKKYLEDKNKKENSDYHVPILNTDRLLFNWSIYMHQFELQEDLGLKNIHLFNEKNIYETIETKEYVTDQIIETFDYMKEYFNDKPTLGKNIIYYANKFKFSIIDHVTSVSELKYFIKNKFLALFMVCDKNKRIQRKNKLGIDWPSLRIYGSTIEDYNEYDVYVEDKMRPFCLYKIEGGDDLSSYKNCVHQLLNNIKIV